MSDESEAGGEGNAERAAKARQQMLFARWLKGGRLNVPELREIRPLIGDESYRRALDLLGVSVDDAERAGSAAVSDRTSYAFDYVHYAPTFGRGVRQIKRWVAIGKAAKDDSAQPRPDLPPLDESEKMHAWWLKHMTQRPPQKIVQLALADRTGKNVPTSEAGAGLSIDVTQLNVVEGEQLKQARGFLAATAQLLTRAYLDGSDSEIDRLQRRWEKASNAVRLAENSERAAKKQSGELISKSELLPELSQLLVTVRVMRSTMSRRIRARLPLSSEADAKLDAVIEEERRGEEKVLRRLSFFRNLDEVESELELVA